MYQLTDHDYCLVYAFASGLHYMGHVQEAIALSIQAPVYEDIDGDLAIEKIKMAIKNILPQVGLPIVFNRS